MDVDINCVKIKDQVENQIGSNTKGWNRIHVRCDLSVLLHI